MTSADCAIASDGPSAVGRIRTLWSISRATAIFLAVVAVFVSRVAQATNDEIQVYNAEINDPGQFSIELHNNYAIQASRTPDHPGGMVPNHALNGTPEFAYGMTNWWELGLYLPYARTNDGEFHDGGFKLRTLFVSPHADKREFFYGINFELGHDPLLFDENRWNVEIRPIVGVRFKPIEFIVNPIVDVSVSGKNRPIDFLPAARLAYLVSDTWSVGVENYSGLGPIDHIPGPSKQDQTIFLVTDVSTKPVNIDFGIGRGYTAGAEDRWIVKMILAHPF